MKILEQVKERPILFSGSMVRSIQDDRKTQTRRVVKLPSGNWKFSECFESLEGAGYLAAFYSESDSILIKCPYGKPGDRLWVRETWLQYEELYFYAATDKGDLPDSLLQFENPPRWKPSIHMPRNASRITLEILNLRLERLQDISEEDAIAEGIYKMDSGYWTGCRHPIKGTPKHMIDPIEGFKSLWDSINEARGYSWDSNPYVWAIEFKKVETEATP